MNKAATNKATTATSVKVSVRKLPEKVVKALDDIETSEATAYEAWLVVGRAVWKGAVTNAQVLHFYPSRKSGLSKATAVAKAEAVGFKVTDKDGSIFGSLNTAYEAAKAFLNGASITVEEAKAKSQRKKAGDDISPEQRVKRDGKAAAKEYALAILALV